MKQSFLLFILIFFLAACTAEPPLATDHQDDHVHAQSDHMGSDHDVPADAAAVENPIPRNPESIAAGAVIFAASCQVCHGEEGRGDGIASAGLPTKPTNLHEGHVQGLNDGALFYIVSHGKPATGMPGWEANLTEDERWQLVHFLRTFQP